MDALFALSVILIWILICVVARFITTFIHELGHAVPALLFTHNAVFVFIGSYAEDKKNIFLRFGRLHLYFHFNILKLYSGLCAYEGKISHKQQLIITLSGPFMSLVSALALIFAIHTQSYSDTIITFLAVFIFSFIYDFFINLIPREISGNMKSIRPIDNDGAKIRRLFAEMRLPFPYHEGMKLMARGEYSKASDIFAELISEGHHKRQVYSALIKNLVAEKRFNEALTVFEKYGSRFKLGALDYFTLSKI